MSGRFLFKPITMDDSTSRVVVSNLLEYHHEPSFEPQSVTFHDP
jgi:hypothetical protein